MKRLPLLLCAVALLGSASAAAAPKELGYNVHQSTTVGMDATKDAGLGWVRVDFNWLDAEPTTQGTYNWTLFDAIVNAADTRGLKVLAVIGYTPAWASQANVKGDGSTNDVPKAGTYAPFVTAAVNRYKAKVTYWEIWNEPNLEQFFEGTPQEYIDRIFIPGADAVHAACPACKVMGPGLATVGTAYATWLDAVLTQAGSKLDIVSGHIYNSFPEPGGGAGTTSDSLAIESSSVNRPWWSHTIFYEAFDEPPAPYRWGSVVHDPSAPGGFRPKSVQGFLKKVTSSQPLFGGTKTDCDDGLDNDLDGTVDFPGDKTCTAASSPSEGTAPAADAGAGVVVAGEDAGSGDGGSGNGSSGGGASEGGANGAGSSVEASDDGGCHAATRSNAPLEGFAGALALLGLAGLARLLTRGERARPSS